MTEKIPQKIDLASLEFRLLKDVSECFFQPFVGIGDNQVLTTNSPAFEIMQYVDLRGFILTVCQHKNKDLRCPSSEIPVVINGPP